MWYTDELWCLVLLRVIWNPIEDGAAHKAGYKVTSFDIMR